MLVQVDRSFEDYIHAGEETAQQLLNENGPLIQAIKAYHDFFANVLWADGRDINPFSGVLSMNAFMTFLAGVRIAMTGHAAAIFPVLRTALEYACYAFLMADNPGLTAIWSDRHRDAQSAKASRRAFTAAVRDTTNKLNAIQAHSGDWIWEAYETGIDFGGHPNPKGVFTHLSLKEDVSDTHHHMEIIGLYGSDHFQTQRGLIACLDYGLAIAIVLVRSLRNPSEKSIATLNEMNDLKNSIAAEMNSANG